MARLTLILVLGFASALSTRPAGAQGSAPESFESTAVSPVVSTNPTIRAGLDRIAKGSQLWRAALAAVRETGGRAVVLTSDQAQAATPSGEPNSFDATVLAEAVPVLGPEDQVRLVVVVVNLALLEETHHSRRSLPREIEVDLERILVHEVYGHAVPYLVARHLSGRCADPAPGQRAIEACSIQRENAVREELKLGRRVSYGLDGLSLWRTGSR
jgi:hypothetical protein